MQDSTMPHSIENAPTTAQPVRKNVKMKNKTGRDKKHFNPLLFQLMPDHQTNFHAHSLPWCSIWPWCYNQEFLVTVAPISENAVMSDRERNDGIGDDNFSSLMKMPMNCPQVCTKLILAFGTAIRKNISCQLSTEKSSYASQHRDFHCTHCKATFLLCLY